MASTFLITFGDNDFFLRRTVISETEMEIEPLSIFEAHGLDLIKDFGCFGNAMVFDRAVNDLTQLIFGNHEIDLEIKLVGFIAFDKMQILRNRLIEDEPGRGWLQQRRSFRCRPQAFWCV